MQKYKYTFKELPISQVERDPNQPRKDFGTDGDENRLLTSIEQYGIEQPIIVSQVEDRRYIILDGHRRYICAKKLGFKTLPCRVYPKLPSGEFESRRYEIQNNRRPWKPLERSEAIQRIKNYLRFETNKQIASHLHISESVIGNSLQLRSEKMEHLEMMAKYGLSEAYQVEFVRLKPKIRKIREFEVDDVIQKLFEKVQHKVIRSAKDFRKLGRVFLRATANEKEVYRFLSNPDMTINELENKTVHSGFSLLIEQLIQKVAGKRKDGEAFTSQEKTMLTQLSDLLKKTL